MPKANARTTESKIPRPPNSFMLFRSHEVKSLTGRQQDLSKRIGLKWKALSPAEKKVWEDKAIEEKRRHAVRYPDYAYHPMSRQERKERRRRAKESGVQAPVAGSTSSAISQTEERGTADHHTDEQSVASYAQQYYSVFAADPTSAYSPSYQYNASNPHEYYIDPRLL